MLTTEVLKNNVNAVIISTGNVLNVIKKTGQKPTEEFIDCLKSTIIKNETTTNELIINKADKTIELIRSNDDLIEKITENERKNIKIGAKIFLNNIKHTETNLKNAIDNILRLLNVDFLDNLILAYHPKLYQKTTTNGVQVNGNGVSGNEEGDEEKEEIHSIVTNGDSKEGVIEWGGGDNNALSNLQKLWKTLEQYSLDKKIEQLGIADLDCDSLKELYSGCKVFPTIAQINLSTCCVVPPPLQEFCNKHDIQLLTHSDPEEILTKSTLNELNMDEFHPMWTTRYQVHVKCRGVLTAKGFIVGIEKD